MRNDVTSNPDGKTATSDTNPKNLFQVNGKGEPSERKIVISKQRFNDLRKQTQERDNPDPYGNGRYPKRHYLNMFKTKDSRSKYALFSQDLEDEHEVFGNDEEEDFGRCLYVAPFDEETGAPSGKPWFTADH